MARNHDNPVVSLMRVVSPEKAFTQLVLTRRKDECVVVSSEETGEPLAVISINEVSSDGCRVKIGCHAPSEISVDRDSVYLVKQMESGRLSETQEGEMKKWLEQHHQQ